jgi:hypothetical protein
MADTPERLRRIERRLAPEGEPESTTPWWDGLSPEKRRERVRELMYTEPAIGSLSFSTGSTSSTWTSRLSTASTSSTRSA